MSDWTPGRSGRSPSLSRRHQDGSDRPGLEEVTAGEEKRVDGDSAAQMGVCVQAVLVEACTVSGAAGACVCTCVFSC